MPLMRSALLVVPPHAAMIASPGATGPACRASHASVHTTSRLQPLMAFPTQPIQQAITVLAVPGMLKVNSSDRWFKEQIGRISLTPSQACTVPSDGTSLDSIWRRHTPVPIAGLDPGSIVTRTRLSPLSQWYPGNLFGSGGGTRGKFPFIASSFASTQAVASLLPGVDQAKLQLVHRRGTRAPPRPALYAVGNYSKPVFQHCSSTSRISHDHRSHAHFRPTSQSRARCGDPHRKNYQMQLPG